MIKNDICSINCTFVKCVNDLNNVITKGTLHQIKKFVYSNCRTAVFRADAFGRLPLHVAASCGKIDVLKWIISLVDAHSDENNCAIDDIDEESGWSSLHKAAYYGRIASVILLIKNGASLWLKDRDGCNPLDILIKDISPWYHEPILKRVGSANRLLESWSDLHRSGQNEVYTWGTNENMTIGSKGAKSKPLPEVLTFFTKKDLSIKQIVMCKFHSIFLTTCGRVYACGNGRDGRLGLPKVGVSINPQLVQFDDKISFIAASTYHSVFLSENGLVLGINPPPTTCLQPTCVTSLTRHRIVGCTAGLCHTVAWSENALFTFGTNAGQMGHKRGELFIVQPREVSYFHNENNKFVHIHACDSATAVATAEGMIYLLHKYTCRKILSKHMDVMKLQVGGGKLDVDVLSQVKFFDTSLSKSNVEKKKTSDNNDVRLLILKSNGTVLSWRSLHSTIDHCQLDDKQLRWVRDVTICNVGLVVLFTSIDGTVYKARYATRMQGKKKPHRQEFFTSLELMGCDPIQRFSLEQIPCAFRAHTCVLGPKGANAAVIQCRPSNFITEVPVVEPPNLDQDLALLFSRSTETDSVHDVIIRIKTVGREDVTVPAHLLVLASRSEFFAQLIATQCRRVNVNDARMVAPSFPDIIIENACLEIFRDCLEYVYSRKCAVLERGASSGNEEVDDPGPMAIHCHGSNRVRSHNVRRSRGKNVKLTRRTLLKRLLTSLGVDFVDNSNWKPADSDESDDDVKTPAVKSLSLSSFPYLHDCIVVCSDSIEFRAHKCVLAARIPYFSGMLFSPWVEMGDEAAFLKVPVPSDIFQYVFNFSYSDSVACLSGAKSIETWCEMLAAADLLLMNRLKQIIESQIVPLLTLSNVAAVCEVAMAFNGNQLYESCLQFCCFNFPALLHTSSFYSIDDSTLLKLENLYRSHIANAHMRAMPPSSEGPSIDHLPEYCEELDGDDDDASLLFESSKPNFPSSNTRRRTSSQSTGKGACGPQNAGILVSDLLHIREKSEEEKIVDAIKRKQGHFKSPKKSSKIVAKQKENGEANSGESKVDRGLPSGAVSRKKVGKTRNEVSTKKSTDGDVTDGQPDHNHSLIKAYANYNRLFPQLGADSPKPATHPSAAAAVKKTFDSPSLKSGSSGVEITKQKKKAKRERLKSKEKGSPPIDIKKQPVNAWGVSNVYPVDGANTVTSPLQFDRLSSPPVQAAFQTNIAKSPEQNKNNSPWQNPPGAMFVSPPPPIRSKFDGAGNPVSLVEIIHDELKNKEILHQATNKSMDLIQKEETAMNELKTFYESSNQISGAFVTVSRLPQGVARDLRSSAIQRK